MRFTIPHLCLYTVILLLSWQTGISQDDNRFKIIDAEVFEYRTVEGKEVQQFRGNVLFQRGTMLLYTDEATFLSETDELQLNGFVKMTDVTDTLYCGQLTFFNDMGYLKASENVIFQQKDQIITCDSLYFWTEIDSGRAVSNVTMKQPGRNVITDEFIYERTEGYRGTSFHAIGSTSIHDEDRIITGSEILYDDDRQQLQILENCSISDDFQGLSGMAIEVQYADSLLEHIDVIGEAAVYSLLETRIDPESNLLQSFQDNMSARELKADFIENKLSRLKLIGMATTEYHVIQDSLLQGVNTATGDTILVNFDDGIMQRIQVFGGGRGEFKPEKTNSQITTEILYRGEYMDYHVNEQMSFLKDDASVSYQNNKLTAGSIKANWETNVLIAEVVDEVLPTITSIGNEPMSGNFMEFNLLTEHGRVIKGKTRFNDGNYYGNEVYRDRPDVYHVDNSLYSTCDLDEPHFYFYSNEMKMIPDDKVIAKPLILYIYDLPVFGLPFGVFPNKGGGRHSGWIMPNFGTSAGGTYFQGLGYYWAPNDYIGSKLRLNFRDKKGIDLIGVFNYNKRYQFYGNMNATLYREILTDDISDLFSKKVSQNWSVFWKHSHTIDPTQRLVVEANYQTSNTLNQDYGWDLTSRLKQKLESKANYSKNWTKNSLSINLSESFDLLAESKSPADFNKSPGEIQTERTRRVPNISFSHNQTQIFGKGKKSKWYHSMYWSMNSSLRSTQLVGLIAETDSTWEKGRNYQRDTGISHSFRLTSPQSLFGWLTVSPSMNIKEDWVFKYREAVFDSAGAFVKDGSSVEYTEVEKFLPRHTGNLSLSASTKFYGVFPTAIGWLSAIRHIATPTLTYNWSPDFSKDVMGLDPGYFQEDVNGELFDKFAGSTASGTSRYESKTIGFSLNNEFQAKLRKGEDQYDKLNLFTWSMGTGYNLMADSLKMSVITSSIRSTIPGGLRLDIKMTHDPYKLEMVNVSSDPETELMQYRRINEYSSFPRMTSIRAGTSFRISGNRFEKSESSAEADTSLYVDETDEMYTDRFESSRPSVSSQKLWNASFTLNYSLTKSFSGDDLNDTKTFWVNTQLGVNLTENWALDYSARIDLETNEMVNHSFSVYRSLHCWEFRFQWLPSGVGNGFRLLINVKNPDLKDIKLKSSGGKLSRLW